MDSINSRLASQSLKLIVRHIMNQRKAIFRGEYNAAYPHLVDAFDRLRRDAGDLNDDLVEDLDTIIQEGICEMARHFGNGQPVQPSTMNVLIVAIRAYNATASAPFRFNDKVPFQNVTTDGLLFLSNVIMKIIKSFDAHAESKHELFSLDHPPWQLAARRVPPPPRPSHAGPMERAPRIFIIHAHGMLPVVQGEVDDPSLPVFENPVTGYSLGPFGHTVSSSSYRRNRVVTLVSRVDTFTSAKFGKALWLTITDDPPQVRLIDKLTSMLQQAGTDDVRPGRPVSPPPTTKAAFRKMIKRALCDTRTSLVPADEQDNCRFRCHRVGRKIADVSLFCDGAALVEGIVMFDMQTGDVEDVTKTFGLVDKRTIGRPVEEYEKFMKFNHGKIELLVTAKTKAEQELAAMQANPAVFKGKTFRMHSLAETIKKFETTIRNMDRYSNFDFSDDVKERGGDKIRLSRLVDIGISGGLIDPVTDFVVVLSCRVPDQDMPLGAVSPRSSSDSSVSEGGGGSGCGGKRRVRSGPKTKTKTKTKHNASKKIKFLKRARTTHKRRV